MLDFVAWARQRQAHYRIASVGACSLGFRVYSAT